MNPAASNPLSDVLGMFLGTMLDAVVAVDEHGVIVGWNERATQTFGWTAAEAVGRPMVELIVPNKHRSDHNNGMRRYVESGEQRVLNRRIEISAVDRSGREFPIELSIIEPTGDAGAAFIGFMRDISARRESQERLELSEESLRLTTEAAEIGIWDLDLLSNRLTWSDRTKAMFGISPGVDCSMDDFYDGLHPEDRPATSEAFAAALDPLRREVYDVQYRTIGKEDGLIRWVAAKGKGIFTPDGVAVRAVGTAIDVTSRRLALARHAFMLELIDVLRGADTAAALQRACAIMGRHFGVARVGYGQLDAARDVFDYSICWTDGSVAPLLGLFPASAFGKKIVAKLSSGETVAIDDLFSSTLSDESETRATAASVDTKAILVVPFLRAGRLRTIIYLNDRPVRHWSADEIGFLEEVAERTRQVIERGEAEAALRELNATLEQRVEERTRELQLAEEALRQAQKMEAIGQLTGGLAHDFNNLLAGISGSLELMHTRLAQGRVSELDRYLTGAQAATKRAAALTHRLLAFSRRQTLDPKTADLNRVVSDMLELINRSVGPTIEVEAVAAAGLWTTLVDVGQLENALLNLCINARDAMPDGGKLTIETANRWLDDRAAKDRGLTPGQYLSLCVSDTGTGMSPDLIARAFDPFFTTKPIGQGTGLGLSMVYGFAGQSHGTVRIYSELGKGTMVCLYLPRHAGEVQDVDEPLQLNHASKASNNETILLVDDEPLIRMVAAELLQELGYNVMEAEDGPRALKILESGSDLDLLITDVGLPNGINGRQLADAARVLRPDLQVLFITGYAENAVLNHGHLAQGMQVITKPFAADTFARRVAELIRTAKPAR